MERQLKQIKLTKSASRIKFKKFLKFGIQEGKRLPLFIIIITMMGIAIGIFVYFHKPLLYSIESTYKTTSITDDENKWETIQWRGNGMHFSVRVPPEIKAFIDQPSAYPDYRGGIISYREREGIAGIPGLLSIRNFYNDDPDLRTWVSKYEEQQKLGEYDSHFTEQAWEIDNRDSYVVDVRNESESFRDGVSVFIQKGSFVYIISIPHQYWLCDEESECGYRLTFDNNREIFEKILKSFRFLNPLPTDNDTQIDTSDWVSYAFDSLGISIRHPITWEFIDPLVNNFIAGYGVTSVSDVETLASEKIDSTLQGYGGAISIGQLSVSTEEFINDYNSDPDQIFQIDEPVKEYEIGNIKYKKILAGTKLGLHIDFLVLENNKRPPVIIQCDLENPMHRQILNTLEFMEALKIQRVSDFLKYRNEEYFFSVRYPAKYNLTHFKISDEVKTESGDNFEMIFNAQSEPGKGFELNIFSAPYEKLQQSSIYPLKKNETKEINGSIASITSSGDYVFESNSYTYIISSYAIKDELDQQILNNFCLWRNNQECKPLGDPQGQWDIDFTYEEEKSVIPLLNNYLIYQRQRDNKIDVIQRDLVKDIERTIKSYTISSYVNNDEMNRSGGASLSSNGEFLAYIDERGLVVLNINSQSEEIIISQQQNRVPESEEPPLWSINPKLPVYSIHNPQWSADNKYLSFVQLHYEGTSMGVINIETRDYFTVKINGEGASMGINNFYWLPNNEGYIFLTSGYEVGELFYSANITNRPDSIISSNDFINNEIAVSPSGTSLLLSAQSEDNNQVTKLILIDLPSGKQKIITHGSQYKALKFSQDEKTIYAIQDEGIAEALHQYSLLDEQNSDTTVAYLPREFDNWNFLEWTPEGYAVILGQSNSLGFTKLMILDLSKNKVIYQSGMETFNQTFLGLIE